MRRGLPKSGSKAGSKTASKSAAKTRAGARRTPARTKRRVGPFGWLKAIVTATLIAAGIYVGFRYWPGILFPYEVAAGNIVLHARTPLPTRAKEIAEAARQHVSRSPFYVPADRYDVYLTDSSSLYGFFALWTRNSSGLADVYLSRNVFLRPAHVERNQLLGVSGREGGPDRPLSYYVAHEVTHVMVARRIGRRAYYLLEPWQVEGYADYVGRNDLFDFARMRGALVEGRREMDPRQSGLYFRYHLLVAELLNHRGMNAIELLSKPRDAEPIERRLRGLKP